MKTENDRINSLCEAICTIVNCIGQNFTKAELTKLQTLLNDAYIDNEKRD